MRTWHVALLMVGAFGIVTGGFARDASAACPMGKTVTQDTAGHCCWPGQAWSGTACVGQPTCPKEMALSADQKACELLPCPDKQVRTPDGVHCCWPGQGWSSSRGMCIGEPKCDRGYIVESGACVPGPTIVDTDQDLIVDADDTCPSEPEDPDGFEDEDGCPDADNDEDGIVDFDDACAMDAEDPDGYRDDDGCPEADNDEDGVTDLEDKCPDKAEDKENRGQEGADGCPDDDDQDGVADGDDQCPETLEDADGFEDGDGCPEFDNDNDGFADAEDGCPHQAEDFDLIGDDDGCPERDDDADVIADLHDLCPDEAEDSQGSTPSDGCEIFASEKYATSWFADEAIIAEVSLNRLSYESKELGAINFYSIQGLGHWDWFQFGGSLGFGWADDGDRVAEDDTNFGEMFRLQSGVQVLSWPTSTYTGYSLLNPTIGLHAGAGFLFAGDAFHATGGLWFRQASYLGNWAFAFEYLGDTFFGAGDAKDFGVFTFSIGYAIREFQP